MRSRRPDINFAALIIVHTLENQGCCRIEQENLSKESFRYKGVVAKILWNRCASLACRISGFLNVFDEQPWAFLYAEPQLHLAGICWEESLEIIDTIAKLLFTKDLPAEQDKSGKYWRCCAKVELRAICNDEEATRPMTNEPVKQECGDCYVLLYGLNWQTFLNRMERGISISKKQNLEPYGYMSRTCIKIHEMYIPVLVRQHIISPICEVLGQRLHAFDTEV